MPQRRLLPEQVMTKRERNLRKRFQLLLTRHRRSPTGGTWFALGTILVEAYELSAELGHELSSAVADPITCWRQCVRLQPKRKDAWLRLSEAYFIRDDQANACKALTRVVKLDPRAAAAWNRLAILTLPPADDNKPALLRRAERYFRKAIAADSRGTKLGWEPYAWIAEVAERLRDDPGALAWYAEANRRGDRYAAARKQVIEDHGARRRAKRGVARK